MSPNIRVRILFSNTLSLHSSLNVRDHVSQPYSTTTLGNIIVNFKIVEIDVNLHDNNEEINNTMNIGSAGIRGIRGNLITYVVIIYVFNAELLTVIISYSFDNNA